MSKYEHSWATAAEKSSHLKHLWMKHSEHAYTFRPNHATCRHTCKKISPYQSLKILPCHGSCQHFECSTRLAIAKDPFVLVCLCPPKQSTCPSCPFCSNPFCFVGDGAAAVVKLSAERPRSSPLHVIQIQSEPAATTFAHTDHNDYWPTMTR